MVDPDGSEALWMGQHWSGRPRSHMVGDVLHAICGELSRPPWIDHSQSILVLSPVGRPWSVQSASGHSGSTMADPECSEAVWIDRNRSRVPRSALDRPRSIQSASKHSGSVMVEREGPEALWIDHGRPRELRTNLDRPWSTQGALRPCGG